MTRSSFPPILHKLCAIKLAIFNPYCRCLSSNFSSASSLERCSISRKNTISSRLFYRTLRFNVKKDDFAPSVNDRKILKAAIVGIPNAGKSTLINQIIGRNVSTVFFTLIAFMWTFYFQTSFILPQVFPVSCKVHTTRCRARAVMVVENTQLVFLDTPGVVSAQDSVKLVQ